MKVLKIPGKKLKDVEFLIGIIPNILYVKVLKTYITACFSI
jgi:hypothetical protein